MPQASIFSLTTLQWQLAAAHPNPAHWNDPAAHTLTRELQELSLELQRVEQAVLLVAIGERVLGV